MNIDNFSSQSMPQEFQSIAFAEIAWVFSQDILQVIDDRLSKIEDLILSKDAILCSLQKACILRISQLITPCFTSEMALQRSFGHLQADDSRKRYLEFVQLAFHNDFLKAFFNHYPILLHSINTTLSHCKNVILELFERLESDFKEIQTSFSRNSQMQLHNLYMDLSDVHHDGRTVIKLVFNDFSLIYKPKDLQIEKSFNDFLSEINHAGFALPLKTINVLPKDGYGWVEFVEHYACIDLEQVKNFYKRSGACLFLWYLFEGTDAHCENLICCGQYPVMIDLETLFHPDLHEKNPEINPFKNTLLRTGLLPFVGGLNALNYGGLTANYNEVIPEYYLQFTNINTDTMQLIRKTCFIGGNKHLVYFNDAPMSFVNHIADICNGFEMMYHFFWEKKKFFLNGSSLQKLLQSKIRVVLRATSIYANLQQCLNFPVNLKSLEKRVQFLNKSLSGYENEILECERKQILNHDIPYFYSFADSKNLYSLDGMCLKDFFVHNTSDVVKMKIEKLNFRDKDKQLKILNTSLSGFLAKKTRRDQAIFKDISLKAAQLIAEKSLDTKKNLHENTLYNGQSGVALLFAALSKISKDKKWADIASEIMDRCFAMPIDMGKESLCAFSGVGSLIYAALTVGQLISNQKIVLYASTMIDLVQEKYIDNAKKLDFVGGLSGFITALTTCYKKTKDYRFLRLAIKSADQLIDIFEKEKGHEIGLSHGLTGYAHGLLQLRTYSKNPKYFEYAKKIIDLEQNMYLASNQARFNSWCHGHTGIGLSRLSTINHYDNELVRKEIEIALMKTKDSLGEESSLCCGDFGRFAFLMEYARKEKSHQLEKEVKQMIYLFVNEYLRTNGESSSLKENFRFGFMQGIAGIGYELLRFSNPTKLPQVLLLQ